MNNSPVGIFDSGVGGLSVLKEVIKTLPNENLIYLGDTARVPYGTRDNATIKKFSLEIIDFLLKQNVKAIVVACNTISAISLEEIKLRAGKIPVIDVISPTVSIALEEKDADVLGVIGTRATINSSAFQAQIKSKNEAKKVFATSCPTFVPLVEDGLSNDKSTEIIAEKYLSYFDDKNIDLLILGCTHYPMLRSTIQKVLRRKIKIIDSAEPTANYLKQVLKKENLLRKDDALPFYKFYVTDNPDAAKNVANIFFENNFPYAMEKISLT